MIEITVCNHCTELLYICREIRDVLTRHVYAYHDCSYFSFIVAINYVLVCLKANPGGAVADGQPGENGPSVSPP